jgi:transcriptional regulator with XRE-family HTH domain
MKSTNAYQRWEIARAFGLTLKTLRKERRLSQDRLAELCNFDRTYPSLLERGLRSPTVSMLLRVANALDVEPARLSLALRKIAPLRPTESLRLWLRVPPSDLLFY